MKTNEDSKRRIKKEKNKKKSVVDANQKGKMEGERKRKRGTKRKSEELKEQIEGGKQLKQIEDYGQKIIQLLTYYNGGRGGGQKIQDKEKNTEG